MVIFIIYAALGYWAACHTVYANSVIIASSGTAIFFKKFYTGVLLGWILIPVAIIKMIFGSKG